jgi:hypothetical protein
MSAPGRGKETASRILYGVLEKDMTLNIPTFPPLQWEDYFWVGEVTLPSWSGFQTRRGWYGSVSSDSPSNGTARLRVMPEDADRRGHPTAEQEVAFKYLLDNEAAVAASVLQALFNRYPDEKAAYVEAYSEDEAEETLPDITDPSGLRALIGLSNVHVLSVVKDGAAYVGFEFGCIWDEEHGAGVMDASGACHCGRPGGRFFPGVDRQA